MQSILSVLCGIFGQWAREGGILFPGWPGNEESEASVADSSEPTNPLGFHSGLIFNASSSFEVYNHPIPTIDLLPRVL